MGRILNVSNLTYCGKEGQDIFSKMVYNLPLPAGITKKDNLKGKEKVYTGDISNVWQVYTCAFTPDGTATLDETYIEPARIKVNLEECYDKFDSTYFVEQKQISLNEGIPQTFEVWYFEKLKEQMALEYQEIFWRGDKTNGTGVMRVIDGAETILKNSSKATVIAGSTLTINNIIASVEAAVMKAMDVAATNRTKTDDYGIILNKYDYDLLIVALGKDCSCNKTDSIFNNYAKNGDTITIFGIKVYKAEVSRSTIIVGPVRNLVIGFDTEDSQIEYKFINMRETTGDNMFRVIALSNIAAAVAWQELFVISAV